MHFVFLCVASGVRQKDDTCKHASERAKRRHARPHELDSDSDDQDEGKEEVENTFPDEENASNRVGDVAPADDDPQILVNDITEKSSWLEVTAYC